MEKKTVKSRTHRVALVYNDEEIEAMRKNYARSTCQTLSSYLRKVSLEEPVQMIIRNGSFDYFVDEIIVLRKEMKLIRQQVPLPPDMQTRLVELQEETQTYINKIADLCMPH
jgi:hypothetical protein